MLKYIFILSIGFVLFTLFTFFYNQNLFYFFLIINVLVLIYFFIEKLISDNLKIFNQNIRFSVFLFCILINITLLLNNYNVFNVKLLVEESINTVINLPQDVSNIEKEKNINLSKNEFYYEPQVFNHLDDDFLIFKKIQNFPINILNNKFEVIDKISNHEKISPLLMFDNGDLLVTDGWWHRASSVFRIQPKPYKKIWQTKGLVVHHYASSNEQFIYAPSYKYTNWRKYKNSKQYNLLKNFNCSNNHINVQDAKSPKDYEDNFYTISDLIVKIDVKTGEILQEFNLLNYLMEIPHYYNLIVSSKTSRCWDILHLNDTRVLNNDEMKLFNIGVEDLNDDILLISMRDISTIAVINISKGKEKIYWSSSNLINGQHSPRIYLQGSEPSIIVFNNEAFGHSTYEINDKLSMPLGSSAVTQISIKNNSIIGNFTGSTKEKFQSFRQGRLQVANNIIYVLSSEQGELFQIECKIKKNISNKNCKKRKLFLEEPIDRSKNTVDTLLTIFIMDIYNKIVTNGNIRYEYLK